MRMILAALFLLVLLSGSCAFAQSPNGSIRGIVLDPDAKSIPGAEVIVVNDATGLKYVSATNGDGIYAVENLPPGPYRIQVSKVGFKAIIKPDIILNVQDALSLNFTLPIGAPSVVVTVEGGAPMVNTTDASVSTVVDRQFAENLPLNGRSFQTLIQLTPGVVLTSPGNQNSGADSGQFSINGQRASSNYWMVDGVSANLGGTAFFGGNGLAGAVGTTSVFGGTNSLVSVDALEEFRIQTSTYAPEFGRTPGAQIAIATRSGSNQFHGSVFNYLRNDIFDASDWFNGYTHNPPLPKSQERQNDFGGTVSGPVLKERTFFFFSYEGLRLRLPQTTLTTVPDLQARQSANPAVQPFLNSYPLDASQPDLGNGRAQFDKSYSDPASLDAYSIRVDHKLKDKWLLFGRYNFSPSEIAQRGFAGGALSEVSPARVRVQTTTIGAIWNTSAHTTNDLRFNYSRTNAGSRLFLDNFGGAVPLSSLPLPNPFTTQNANLTFNIFSLAHGSYAVGSNVSTVQRQVNVVDSASIQEGAHTLKFGVDFRRLSPVYAPALYDQLAAFLNVSNAANGSPAVVNIQSKTGVTYLFHNLGVFGQDTWRVKPRLTVTYGVRWDLDVAPSTTAGPSLPAAIGFDAADLSRLALAPGGTPAFRTSYGNVAPRIGVAYQISQRPGRETVLRGGFGVFYDLATSEVGNLVVQAGYPYVARSSCPNGSNPACPTGSLVFPLPPAVAAPPQILPPNAANQGVLVSFDPNLKLPYSLEWNIALQHSLGPAQTLTASYIGSLGRRLLQTSFVFTPNPDLGQAVLVDNGPTSDYNALQLQFQRRLSQRLQALASYTWSHSVDDASAGSIGSIGNTAVPSINPSENRGDSDFDIRNAFSAGLTYDIPAIRSHPLINGILRNWSIESIVEARSAPPVNVFNTLFGFDSLFNGLTAVRPDVVPNTPFYIFGSQFPGGKAINASAFTAPPSDSSGNPLRQGDLGRNSLRAFGATQWDLAVHREFPIREKLKVQFRVETFNVLNHPNFGPPNPDLLNVGSTFGLSMQMLGRSLAGPNLGGGGFSPLYEIGGPRSMQFALKLLF